MQIKQTIFGYYYTILSCMERVYTVTVPGICWMSKKHLNFWHGRLMISISHKIILSVGPLLKSWGHSPKRWKKKRSTHRRVDLGFFGLESSKQKVTSTNFVANSPQNLWKWKKLARALVTSLCWNIWKQVIRQAMPLCSAPGDLGYVTEFTLLNSITYHDNSQVVKLKYWQSCIFHFSLSKADLQCKENLSVWEVRMRNAFERVKNFDHPRKP